MTADPKPRRERRSSPNRHCEICLEGVYITRLETDSYGGPGMLRRVGITGSEQDVLWHVEGCNHCGHVQIFRRDWRNGTSSDVAEGE